MKRQFTIKEVFIYSVIILLLASCSATRKVPEGDALYTGAKIKLDGPDLSRKQKKNLRNEMASLTRPEPNKKILGFRYKLFFYNIGILKNKLGEPPVLLSDVKPEYNEKVLSSSLQNRGFFDASVRGEINKKKKKASVAYIIQTGLRYYINEVHFPEDSNKVLQKHIAESSERTFLKAKQPFDLAVIKGERERIDAYLKQRGFYYFNPDFLIVEADSTIGNHSVNLYLKVKSETPASAKELYRVNDVYTFTNYRLLDTAATDSQKKNADFYNDYYVVDKNKLYKPSLFERAMQFQPGDVYNQRDHNRTLSRLINLNLFRFVKNSFRPVKGEDTASLDVFYYLTPGPKKSIQGEINGNTKSNNLVGSSITIGWMNRNTFRGGELLSIKGTGGFEVQYSGNFRGYNTYRAGIETALSFPRFLVPFINLRTKGSFMPKTNISLAYDILNKRKLYTMQSFRAEYGYVWKEDIRKEHTLNPISVNYVQPLQVTDLYMSSAANNPVLLKAIEKQFILGSNYNFNYNQLQGKPAMSGGFYFNGGVDLSGNIAGFLMDANVRKGNVRELFNVQYSQYAKFEADVRAYAKISSSAVWANRLIMGFGLPYGNSLSLPYVKQFFIGGTNSIRAFRSRSLGPGTYRDTVSTLFLPDQSGDMKLEANTELRAKLAGPLHGALFLDAGNIWLFNSDSSQVGGRFSKTFLKEIAVGGGAGIRLDISFLVIRLDVAVPLRKPYLPEGERWVLDRMDFSSKSWRKDNIVFNLGIGYPF